MVGWRQQESRLQLAAQLARQRAVSCEVDEAILGQLACAVPYLLVVRCMLPCVMAFSACAGRQQPFDCEMSGSLKAGAPGGRGQGYMVAMRLVECFAI